MGIQTIQAKSILQKSNIPGMQYVINPYVGCVHGCAYCYARFMKRFTNHPEPWGRFLDVRANAPEVLQKELSHRKEPLTEEVFLSSVTDPYQPPEEKFQITRLLLKVLLEFQVPISILTKSELVIRDLDLLKQFANCKVGISLGIIDDGAASRFEPRASLPSKRVVALNRLASEGISTYAFISPYLPKISKLEETVDAVQGAAKEIGVEVVNTRGGNWTGVDEVLEKWFPEARRECAVLSRTESYWSELERRYELLIRARGIEAMGFFRH